MGHRLDAGKVVAIRGGPAVPPSAAGGTNGARERLRVRRLEPGEWAGAA